MTIISEVHKEIYFLPTLRETPVSFSYISREVINVFKSWSQSASWIFFEIPRKGNNIHCSSEEARLE
jgi:hypothetical protein